jgi:hypothetical protein
MSGAYRRYGVPVGGTRIRAAAPDTRFTRQTVRRGYADLDLIEERQNFRPQSVLGRC